MSQSISYLRPSERIEGWSVYVCNFCGAKGHSPYTADKVLCICIKDWRWDRWGRWLAWMLASAGITKPRVNAVYRWFGFSSCRCADYERWLNNAGGWFRQKLLGFIGRSW